MIIEKLLTAKIFTQFFNEKVIFIKKYTYNQLVKNIF